MLDHPRSEIIAHLAEGIDGVKVDDPDSAPPTNRCETCALTKAHEIVSRRPGQKEPADYPLSRIGYDLIPMNEGYNEDF
jgi:hypothetical protein